MKREAEMKTIFYSFSKDAKQSDKSNLCKLLQIREKKGITKRIKRGLIAVQDDHYDDIVKVIKRYKGIIDNPSKPSDLSDGSLVNKLLNEIEQVKEKFSKLESAITKLNFAKETQKKDNDQINERLDKFEKNLSTVLNTLTELKKPTEKRAAYVNNTDLETIQQSLQEIRKDIVGRLDDLEARLNAFEELAGGNSHYF